MHNYKELIVWQKARELVKIIYLLTNGFPKEEMFGLTSQIRRAAVSVPSNIAEGAGHSSKKEFIRFLEIACASSCELDTQIILSMDLKLLSENEVEISLKKIDEIQKMLSGLKKSLMK